MTNIQKFTAEEQQLAALYMPKENRLQLIRAIVKDKTNMEGDVKRLAESTVDKLARMSDRDFCDTGFVLAL